MDLYYLVENSDGFERPVSMGTQEECAAEQRRLGEEDGVYNRSVGRPEWGTIRYYTVPKGEWDSQHCPLIPVDYS